VGVCDQLYASGEVILRNKPQINDFWLLSFK